MQPSDPPQGSSTTHSTMLINEGTAPYAQPPVGGTHKHSEPEQQRRTLRQPWLAEVLLNQPVAMLGQRKRYLQQHQRTFTSALPESGYVVRRSIVYAKHTPVVVTSNPHPISPRQFEDAIDAVQKASSPTKSPLLGIDEGQDGFTSGVHDVQAAATEPPVSASSPSPLSPVSFGSPDSEELHNQLRFVSKAVQELSRSVSQPDPPSKDGTSQRQFSVISSKNLGSIGRRRLSLADSTGKHSKESSVHSSAIKDGQGNSNDDILPTHRRDSSVTRMGTGVGLGLFDTGEASEAPHHQSKRKQPGNSRAVVHAPNPTASSPSLSPLLGVSRRHWDITTTSCTTSSSHRKTTKSCATTTERKTTVHHSQSTTCSTTPMSSPSILGGAAWTSMPVASSITASLPQRSPTFSDIPDTPMMTAPSSPLMSQQTDMSDASLHPVEPLYVQPENDTSHVRTGAATFGAVIAASLAGSLLLLATVLWALFRQRRRVQRRRHLAQVLERVGVAGGTFDEKMAGRASGSSSDTSSSTIKESFDAEKCSADLTTVSNPWLMPSSAASDSRLTVRMSRDLASSGLVSETLSSQRDTTFSWQHPTLSVPPAAARSLGSGHYVKKRNTLPAKPRVAVPPYIPSTPTSPPTWLASTGDVACVQSEAILGVQSSTNSVATFCVGADRRGNLDARRSSSEEPSQVPRRSESIYSIDSQVDAAIAERKIATSDTESHTTGASTVVKSLSGQAVTESSETSMTVSVGGKTNTTTSASDLSEGKVCIVTATGRRSARFSLTFPNVDGGSSPRTVEPLKSDSTGRNGGTNASGGSWLDTLTERPGILDDLTSAILSDAESDMDSTQELHSAERWSPHPFTAFYILPTDGAVSDDDATTGYDAGGETDTDRYEQCQPLFSAVSVRTGLQGRNIAADGKRSSVSPLLVPSITLTMDDDALGMVQRPLSLDSTEVASSDSMDSDTLEYHRHRFVSGSNPASSHEVYAHSEAAKSTVYLGQSGSTFEMEGSSSGEDTDAAVCHSAAYAPASSSPARMVAPSSASGTRSGRRSPLQHSWTREHEADSGSEMRDAGIAMGESVEECLEWDDFPTLPPWTPVKHQGAASKTLRST